MVITAEVITLQPGVGVATLIVRSPEVGAVNIKLTRDDLSALAHGAITALFRWEEFAALNDGRDDASQG